jgi:hypothetical protein
MIMSQLNAPAKYADFSFAKHFSLPVNTHQELHSNDSLSEDSTSQPSSSDELLSIGGILSGVAMQFSDAHEPPVSDRMMVSHEASDAFHQAEIHSRRRVCNWLPYKSRHSLTFYKLY